MLVNPSVVDRPGSNGTPNGACELCGASHPDHGPYACSVGKFYCLNDIKTLARSVGQLVGDEAQAKFEELATKLAHLHVSHNEMAVRVDQLAAELLDAQTGKAAADARIEDLERDLTAAQSYASAFAEHYLKPKRGAK